MILDSVKNFFILLGKAFIEFRKNDPLRLAAATAFFTTFALPPILIILLQLFGTLFSIENLSDKFFIRLAEILGTESTEQIKDTFSGFKAQAKNWYITLGGIIFLMFVATTLFRVIKDSLNELWNIKIERKGQLSRNFEKRGVSMIIIILSGLLFITGMVAEGFQVIFGNYVNELSPGTGSTLNIIINKIISVLIVTAWFTILFKLLPDARPSWKVVICGGFFTGVLFTIGKFLIRNMLSVGNIHSVFGASTSFVIMLLFVFYSSFILYYGACFTKVYANHINEPIRPGEHAFRYEVVERKKD
jgi:membrane protein